MSATDLDVQKMRVAASEATAMLRVLANADRVLLLCQLTRGEACVSALEEQLGIRQPTLSQQLGILRAEQIVSTRREGRNIFYRISDQRAIAVLATLYGLYCPASMPSNTPSGKVSGGAFG
jgi:DNA-binding transcriptional ArsR family regulator